MDVFSKDAVITKFELKRSIQAIDSSINYLPIDIEVSPDNRKNILIEVPKHASDENISTSIVALKPVIRGSYAYILYRRGGIKKIIGKDIINFFSDKLYYTGSFFRNKHEKTLYCFSSKKDFSRNATRSIQY